MVPGELAASCGHLQKEVEPQKRKDEIGRPAGQQRRESSDASYGFEQCGSSPVNDSDSHAEGHAADSAARAHKQSKWKCQQHNDGGDERECQLLMPLHGERRDIEAGLMQVADVAAQLLPVHLAGLADLPCKVAWRLGQFSEGGDLERRVASDPAGLEIAHPPGLQNPCILRVFPPRASGEDAALDLKRDLIQFEGVEAAEKMVVGIEQAVIVHVRVLTKDPLAPRLVERARGPALNLVAQLVLALDGIRKKRFIEHEHGSRKA